MNEASVNHARNSRIELLRIIAMLLIVACHFTLLISWQPTNAGGWRGAVAYLIAEMGQTGVAIFFSITGYFLVNSKFKASRLIKTWLQTFLYSLVCLILVLLVRIKTHVPSIDQAFNHDNCARTLRTALMPVLSAQYWFITAYILLLLFAPFLNVVVHSVTQRALDIALIFLVIVSLLPLTGLNPFPFSNTVYAITCYLIGARLQIHGSPSLPMGRATLASLAVMAICVVVNRIALINPASPISTFFGWTPDTLMLLRTPGIVVGSIIFMSATSPARTAWSNRAINQTINRIASGMFGVYLIHENKLICSPLWSLVSRILPHPATGIMQLAVSLCAVVVIFAGLTVLALCFDALVVHPLQRLALRILHSHNVA